MKSLLLVAVFCVGCEARHIPTAIVGPTPPADCVDRLAAVQFANPSTSTVDVYVDHVQRFTLPPSQQSLTSFLSANAAHTIQWQIGTRTICPTQTVTLAGCQTAVYPVCQF